MTRYNGNQSKSIIEAYNNEDYMEVTWISDEMYPIDYDIYYQKEQKIFSKIY